MPVQSINAVTLAVRNMALALDFYRDQVGLPLLYGDETASFSSFKVGDGYLNLVLAPEGDGAGGAGSSFMLMMWMPRTSD
jgi:catechol 2,3-dioxygenase-like lactoylglutathione lyase family enzyme